MSMFFLLFILFFIFKFKFSALNILTHVITVSDVGSQKSAFLFIFLQSLNWKSVLYRARRQNQDRTVTDLYA